MADTISVGGKKVSKWIVYGGVGVVVVGGILYFKNKNSSSSSGTSASQSGTDPVTGLPYTQDSQIDPATGMTYLAEAQQYGSVSAAEAAVSANYGGGGVYGGSGYGGTGTSGYSGTGYGYPTYSATGTTGQYATNADWAQAVTAALPGITGDSQTDVAAAVAHYLAALPLTATQVNDIQVALAEFGPPPVGSFSVISQGSGSGTTSTGSSGSSTGSSGSSSGSSAGGPISAAPTGLHVVRVNGLQITVGWDPVKVPSGRGPLAGYPVASGQTPNDTPYQQSVGPGTTEATVTFNSGPGAHGLTHYFVVWARPASPGGPHAGPVSAKTQ